MSEIPPTDPAGLSESVLRAVGVPYLDQYFGTWAIRAENLFSLHAVARAMDVQGHMRSARQRDQFTDIQHPGIARALPQAIDPKAEIVEQPVRNGYRYAIVDGVAIVSVEGTLMKHASSFDESTSTVMLRNTCRKMKDDPQVRSAILSISSPGGTIAGAYDLADDVAALAKAKPTYAYIADLGASAAYLLASQCRSISANVNAIVGSIGSYGVVWDSSKMFQDAGITVHAIVGRVGEKKKVSPYKSAGEPGTKVTEQQLEAWQTQIDDLNELFVSRVESGRGVSRKKVEDWADGNAHVAATARSLGLIDRVESLDQLFARVRKEAGVAGPNAQPARLDAGMSTEPITGAGGCSDGEAASTQSAPVAGPEGDAMSQSNTAPAAATQQAGPSAVGITTGTTTVPVPAIATAAEPKPAAAQPAEKAATIGELEQAFAGEDKFILQSAKNGWTMPEAHAAFAVITADRAARPAPDAKRPGVPAIESSATEKPRSGATDADAHAELEQRAAALVESRPALSHAEATRRILAEDDSLRERFVLEQNEARTNRVRDRIQDRMAVRR